MKTFFRQYGFAVLSGVLLALSFPSWDLFPLAWVALTPLFASTAGLAPKQAAGRFFVAGWIFHSLLLNWLIANAYWAGGWAFIGYQLLCALMGGYWALTGFLWVWLRPRLKWFGGATALAFLWTTMEIAQAHLFTGFGWSAIAYSQGPDLPLLQLAALGGAPLLTFILVFTSAYLGLDFSGSRSISERILRVVCFGGIILFVHGLGMQFLREADTTNGLRVGVIQTNFALEMKLDPEYTEEMVRNSAEKSRALSAQTPVDLIVWPESAIMGPVDDPEIQWQINALLKEIKTPLFCGAERTDPISGGDLNSSYLFEKDGTAQGFYDKVHLAPFGEYVPLSNFLPFLKNMVPAIGDLAQGTEQKVFKVGEHTFGPLICFEVLFGELAEQLRAQGSDFLVVITNLGWFGETSAIPQELELARMRAVETRLPVVHCANTGISGVFDPYGRFQMVNQCFPESTRCAEIRSDLKPDDLIRQRLAGAFTLSKPVLRPLPFSPRYFQCIFGTGTLLLLGLGVFFSKRAKSSQEDKV